MIAHGKEIKVFCGNANRKFAEGVCAELGITPPAGYDPLG